LITKQADPSDAADLRGIAVELQHPRRAILSADTDLARDVK